MHVYIYMYKYTTMHVYAYVYAYVYVYVYVCLYASPTFTWDILGLQLGQGSRLEGSSDQCAFPGNHSTLLVDTPIFAGKLGFIGWMKIICKYMFID